ncbi:unnamed protein product [Coregonus sp. 'balchen']|nr:unnamed protein product [Coregonus sp. 'balchen']
MGLTVTAVCDTAWDRTRVCSDASWVSQSRQAVTPPGIETRSRQAVTPPGIEPGVCSDASWVSQVTAGCDTAWDRTRVLVTPQALRHSALDSYTTWEAWLSHDLGHQWLHNIQSLQESYHGNTVSRSEAPPAEGDTLAKPHLPPTDRRPEGKVSYQPITELHLIQLHLSRWLHFYCLLAVDPKCSA